MRDSFYAGPVPTFTGMSAAPPLEGPAAVLRPARIYLRVRTRFFLTMLAGLAWAAFSLWLSLPWIDQLGHSITLPAAVLVIVGIAIVPGYLNLQLAASLLVDRPPPLRLEGPFPAVSLLMAAYDEAERIEETLTYALRQDYPGGLEIIVADDGSTDATAEIVRARAARDRRIRLLELPHGGKAAALNTALAATAAPLVATIDADTLLMPYALRRAVARLMAAPASTVAVAGAVLVRNSRSNILARAQEWDYFLGISAVKRQQALLQATLVAQGAFSLYDTRALREAGGWPDRIGEDIVLTWSLLANGGLTTFEPTAVAFTDVPVRFRSFRRQRQRWARGMIEGLRDHGLELVGQRRLRSHSVGVNFLFPYLDGVYVCAFLPGVALAATGNFALVGPLTLAVLPLSALVACVMFWRQRRAFDEVGLRVRRNMLGFVVYIAFYPAVLAPISFAGYLKELVGARRAW
jgi:biofilm PGA synthesis N-glycosyltransferase PgaC